MANACARVHCGHCRHTWNVLWRDVKTDYANVCPYCGASIDRNMWDQNVTGTLAAVEDLSMELERDATGYKKTRFSIDFFAD